MSHFHLFDRHRYRLHQARAARAPELFLLREMAERLCDRLSDMKREFSQALILSPQPSIVAEYLPPKAGIVQWLGDAHDNDTEQLNYIAEQFDLVIACGSLHWVNDIPGTLIQIRQLLKADGLFLGMMPGGETLKELRHAFEQAEMQSRGGISPRVSPFVDVRDAGALLQRAGFALPVADSEMVDVSYAHPLKLLHELRAMGQGNAMRESEKGFTPCSLMMQMTDYYMREFSNEDGRIKASFELVTMTGWKPHTSQQQPLKRGSGQTNLGEVLN